LPRLGLARRIGFIKTLELKLEPWGSDKAIRLPAALLDQYKRVDAVEVETLPDALLLHAKRPAKLSWEDTFREMAAEKEDWADFEFTDRTASMKVYRLGVDPGLTSRRSLSPRVE
jgi:antitoxin MazE